MGQQKNRRPSFRGVQPSVTIAPLSLRESSLTIAVTRPPSIAAAHSPESSCTVLPSHLANFRHRTWSVSVTTTCHCTPIG
ncbi:hypothetical protein NL676_037512 [Syzygium grande]|nr:hypothetical protein NL676_037512 [Syzygium grande]